MKQLEVQIMGQSYLLSSPDGGESRLLEAVERVDTAMCKIRDAGKVRARERIAVLAALNMAFDQGERVQVDPPASAAAAPHAGPATGTSATDADNAMLSSLLQRLDHALGGDGQLI
jgi:cell division protein ZapA